MAVGRLGELDLAERAPAEEVEDERVDLLSLAYALDADRGASFAEHCADFGLPSVELPLSVPEDGAGVAEMVEAVHGLHALALALDDEAGGWFTTPQDRRERRGRVDLVRTTSPAALAAQIPARFGLRAPLASLRVADEEHRRWAEAFHGGWCEADPRVLGKPFPAVLADVSSCYPLVAHRLGWWDLMCAEAVRRDDVTEALRRLCRRAASDPTAVLEPDLWRRFGATLVEVIPDGGRFPVSVEDVRRPDGRLEVVSLSSPERPMFYAWSDVVAAAVLSRRAPHVVSAIRYTPEGRQKMRRRIPLLPGVVLHAERDPVLALVRHRRKVKGRDYRLAAELRVVANSLVYGNPSRFDDVWHYDRRTRSTTLGERPGPWCFLPIASSVAAGARLFLAVLDRQVGDLRGAVAYRDTDSAVIPSTTEGTTLDLADGSSLRALSWAEVDHVLGTFAPLSPGRDWPVWTSERERDAAPLRAVVFGPKRHAAYAHGQLLGAAPNTDGDPELADATEANLGGTYADPASIRGRVAPVDGYRRWSMVALVRELRYAEARATDPEALRPGAPWDAGGLRVPALRRYIARTPTMVGTLPACLGPRPGTRYVVGEVDELRRGREPTPVALDPGGDLGDWRDLGWVDMASGEPLRVTTDASAEPDAVLLATLDAKGVAWGRPRRDRIDAVRLDPLRLRRVGRVSGVLDAADDGEPGDLSDYRPRYRRCACGCGTPLARPRGARYVDDEHRRAARNRRRRKPPSPEAAPRCPVDGTALTHTADTYCSARCRETAKKRRQRARHREETNR